MNKSKEIKTKDLRTVGIKYFSEKENGIEVSKNLGYAFLIKMGDGLYVNPFNPLEMYPVFERLPYSNVTRYGEEFGTKVALIGGEAKTGPCYLTVASIGENIFSGDTVTIGQLEDFMLGSSFYFVDRYDVAAARMLRNPIKMQKIMKKDEESRAAMVKFFEDRDVQVQKVNNKK